MKLSLEQIRNITQGASDVIEENGKFKFLRFTNHEEPYVNNPNILQEFRWNSEQTEKF